MSGRPKIQDDDAGLGIDGGGDAFFAGGGFQDIVAVAFQAGANEAAHLHFIVNKQNDVSWPVRKS